MKTVIKHIKCECLISKTAVTNESRPVDHKKTAKYRCNKARVESIIHLKTGKHLPKVTSDWDHKFKYRVGKKVKIPNYNLDVKIICGPGIHYFITPLGAYLYWNYAAGDDTSLGTIPNNHAICLKHWKRKFHKRMVRLLIKASN